MINWNWISKHRAGIGLFLIYLLIFISVVVKEGLLSSAVFTGILIVLMGVVSKAIFILMIVVPDYISKKASQQERKLEYRFFIQPPE